MVAVKQTAPVRLTPISFSRLAGSYLRGVGDPRDVIARSDEAAKTAGIHVPPVRSGETVPVAPASGDGNHTDASASPALPGALEGGGHRRAVPCKAGPLGAGRFDDPVNLELTG